MVLIRTPSGQRIYPLWNTQGLADHLARETGATNFGTYFGHSPTPERAIDAFSQIPMPRSNRVLGDHMAEIVLNGKMPNGVSVWDYFGIRYIIWRQRINWNDGRGWVAMENRGGDTQNHFDHDHISTNVIPRPADVRPAPINLKGIDMLIVNVKNTGIFLCHSSGVSHLHTPDDVFAWVRAGVPYQDKVELTTAQFRYAGWSPEGRMGAAAEDDEDTVPYDEMVSVIQAKLDEVHDEYVRSLQVQ